MPTLPRYFQTACALILLIFSNLLILFGLDIGAKREAAFTTVVNSVAMLGFLIYGAIHTYAKHVAPLPEEVVEQAKAVEKEIMPPPPPSPTTTRKRS